MKERTRYFIKSIWYMNLDMDIKSSYMYICIHGCTYKKYNKRKTNNK